MPSITQSIEKLQKKLDKDPNSLIFSQLAEEHRKEGHLEEALQILKRGLARHPSYWSARVTLGRIHHQMGNISLAREELEKVIQSAPDNLLANRLLGDIYTGLQLPEEALKRYRIVHMVTPADHDLAVRIKRLESEVAKPVPETQPEHSAEMREEPVASEPEPQISVVDEESEDEGYAPTIQIQIPDFLEKTEVPSQTVESHPPETEANAPVVLSPATQQIDEQDLPSVEAPEMYMPDTIIIEPPTDTAVDEAPELDEDVTDERRDSDELSSLASLLLSTEPSSVELSDFDELETELEEEPDFEIEDYATDAPQDRTQPIREGDIEIEEAEELTSETLAELYLSQGFVDKAVKVYERLLLNDPGNTQIERRLKELTASSVPESEPVYKEEPLFAVEHGQAAEMERSASDQSVRRADERRRKINTLENWLTTIRRERD